MKMVLGLLFYVKELWVCLDLFVIYSKYAVYPLSVFVIRGIVYGNPKNQGITQIKFQRNKRSVAEERAGRKLGGLKVLNSYWINEDSTYKYFEIILVDAAHNAIWNDPRINPVQQQRELRGLRGRGHLNTKARPSRRGTWKRNNTDSLSVLR
ncbi:hypothetical protein MKW98_007590 [Papaver atlanticum]|uniref:Ribosomal protein L15 n=1 Tax=Papaver atlanticum TaxID=357466 RepID=A0AAD4SNJ5_9MAGN|nr:hypothetical protein MKW98_007590 [Papaver atlanticum]